MECYSVNELPPVDDHLPDIAKGFMLSQEWLKKYLDTEADRTALFRMSIVNYELGALTKKLVYRRVSPGSPRCGSRADLKTDIGDALANLIMLAELLNVDTFEAITEALERLGNKEWRKV